VFGTASSFGVIALDNDFTPNSALRNGFNSSVFGATFGLAVPVFSGTIDQSRRPRNLSGLRQAE
jgi:hypothetical protein